MAMPVKGEHQQGRHKKKNAAIDSSSSRGGAGLSFCQVFLAALGMFVFGVGVVCWMNCPYLRDSAVAHSAVSSSSSSASSTIIGGNIRARYIHNIQNKQHWSAHENVPVHGPYHKHHELNEPEHEHVHHHHPHSHHEQFDSMQHPRNHHHHSHAARPPAHVHHHVGHAHGDHHHGPEPRAAPQNHHHAEHRHPRSPSNDPHHHHDHFDAQQAIHDSNKEKNHGPKAKDESATVSLLDLSDDYTTAAHQPAPLLEEEKSRAVHVERIRNP
jgi:hypothetical protein